MQARIDGLFGASSADGGRKRRYIPVIAKANRIRKIQFKLALKNQGDSLGLQLKKNKERGER